MNYKYYFFSLIFNAKLMLNNAQNQIKQKINFLIIC